MLYILPDVVPWLAGQLSLPVTGRAATTLATGAIPTPPSPAAQFADSGPQPFQWEGDPAWTLQIHFVGQTVE